MSDDDQEILEICNTVHSIMQSATQDLPIPDPKKTRDIRKKISVFTYGVIIELTEKNTLNKDNIYRKYLMMGGLSNEQAKTIVTRTRDEFTQREFGADCLSAAHKAVNQWLAGDKNVQELVVKLL